MLRAMYKTFGTLALVASLTAGAFGATITVDLSTRYQTIDGFGGFGPMKVWWNSAPYYNSAWIDNLVNNLGLTLLREGVHCGYECTNDNGDPSSIDLEAMEAQFDVRCAGDGHCGANGCDFTDGVFRDHISYWQAMKDEADAKNEPLRFLASVWSPPPWMKKCGCIKGYEAASPTLDQTTVTLIPNATIYQEYAEYLVAYVRLVKKHSGIDVYAVSIQNEPAFEEPYASCVYDAFKYRDVLKVVGQRFDSEGLGDILFVGPEDVSANLMRWRQFVGVTCSDPVAVTYLDRAAVHNYANNGVSPNSPGAQEWANFGNFANQWGKSVWMSESGQDLDWPGAFDAARGVFLGLRYGNVGGWAWWYMCGNMFTNNGSTPAKSFYCYKQYARFIRPGARRVEVTTDDDNLGVVGFHDENNGCYTIVVLNNGSAAVTADITGAGLPAEFECHRTSSGENCASLGSTGPAGVQFPGNSITTLVSGKYTGSGEPPIAAGRPAAARVGALTEPGLRRASLYALDGARVGEAVQVRVGRDGRVGCVDPHARHLAGGMYYLVVQGQGRRRIRLARNSVR